MDGREARAGDYGPRERVEYFARDLLTATGVELLHKTFKLLPHFHERVGVLFRLRPLELNSTQMAPVLKHELLIEVLFVAPRRILEVDQVVPHLVLVEANLVVDVVNE